MAKKEVKKEEVKEVKEIKEVKEKAVKESLEQMLHKIMDKKPILVNAEGVPYILYVVDVTETEDAITLKVQ